MEHLFANNRQWAAGIKKVDPAFFEKLAAQQSEAVWQLSSAVQQSKAEKLRSASVTVGVTQTRAGEIKDSAGIDSPDKAPET